MDNRHDSKDVAAQTSSGIFRRFPKGASLATMNLKHDLDIVYDILEFLRGENGIVVRKTDPRAYIVDGAGGVGGGAGGAALPSGSSTSILLKWDNTNSVWTAVVPFKSEADLISGTLDDTNYVVVGIKASTDGGSALQLQVKKFPKVLDLDDWEEEKLNVVTDSGIVTRTVLVKTATKANVKTFGTGDNRLLLQVDDSGKLTVERGYFRP